jgi:hypothetical protein
MEMRLFLSQLLEVVLGRYPTVFHLFEFLLLVQAAVEVAEETLNLDKVVALAAVAVVRVK